jgi:hypothetical protein
MGIHGHQIGQHKGVEGATGIKWMKAAIIINSHRTRDPNMRTHARQSALNIHWLVLPHVYPGLQNILTKKP